ncbi:MAG: zinc ribbon domain-containing protein [Oscillospiraceae bacterium]|nr:zinc ribbon domain-containing protein [Oscillospiraceae bacterium]
MYCLKCGKETADKQVFCDHCLGVMSDYPVKADAKVHLPHRTEAATPKKQSRKRPMQPEEQLAAMQQLVRRLLAALIAVTVLFLLTAAGLVYTYKSSEALPTVGRNYTINTGRRP